MYSWLRRVLARLVVSCSLAWATGLTAQDVLPGNVDVSFVPPPVAYFADGTPPSTTPVAPGSFVLLTNDGKILIAGGFNLVGGQPRNGLARLNPDGSLDTTFVPELPGLNLFGTLGVFRERGTNGRITVVHESGARRLTADGRADPTFATTNRGIIRFRNLRAFGVQSDGRIIVVGPFGMERFRADGAPDRTFASTLTTNGHVYGAFDDVAILPDDKIVVTGRFEGQMFPRSLDGVHRLTAEGQMDFTFNPPIISHSNSIVTLFGLTLQPDSKILVGGSITNINGKRRLGILRIHPDGSLDESFDAGAGANVPLNDIALQPDGKIIVSGAFTTFGSVSNRYLVRLNPNGSIDPRFNIGTGPNQPLATTMALSDGKVLVAGTSVTNFNGFARERFLRINGLDIPPMISRQPDSLAVAVGDNVRFEVVAAGTPPLRYQWRKNGGNIAGATNTFLFLTNVTLLDAATYTVVITNGFAAPTISSNAVLTVGSTPRAPMIYIQPTNQTAFEGSTVTFGVASTGTPPLRYQWRRNGTNLPGATSAALVLTNVQFSNAATYSVVVSNAVNPPAFSANAVLTVLAAPHPPEITTHPTNQTVFVGDPVEFVVEATGDPPLRYQWLYNRAPLPGATNTTLRLAEVQLTNAGSYSVVVTNFSGMITSQVAVLIVRPPPPPVAPTITRQPANVAVRSPITVNQPELLAPESLPGRAVDLTYVSTGTGGGHVTYRVAMETDGSCAISPGGALGTWYGQWSAITNAEGTLVRFSDARPAGDLTLRTNATYRINDFTGTNALEAGTFTMSNTDDTPAGPRVTFSVAVTGTPPFGYQWLYNGRPITDNLPKVAAVSSNMLVIPSASAAHAGNYSVLVTNRVGRALSRVATLSINGSLMPDTVKPTIAITAPTTVFRRQPTNTYLLTGTAKDRQGVVSVFMRVGNDGPVRTAGTTNWSSTATLTPGTNVIRVRSRNRSGLDSLPAVRTVIYAVTNELSLATNGLGAVTPFRRGQRLEIGQGYVIRATPRPGWLFSNWTGTVVSSAPVLNFLMRSNMDLTANFVPNPFPAFKGTYNGLFQAPTRDAVSHQSSGAFSLAVTDQGKFTGKLIQGANVYPLSGAFDLALSAQKTILRAGSTPLYVTWNLTPDADTVTGTVSNVVWSSEVLGYRATFDARSRPATNFSGLYTLLVAGGTNASQSPVGHGVGNINVNRAGGVTFSGALADGSPVTLTTTLAANGQWPFYANLYRGKGSIFGWLTLGDTGTDDLTGPLLWTKFGGVAGPLYPRGFTNDTLSIGSRYVPPAPRTPVFDWIHGLAVLDAGNLSSVIANAVTLDVMNKFVISPPNSNRVALALVPSNGQINGGFVHPQARRSAVFKGVVLPRQRFGAGYFLGPTEGGAFILSPVQAPASPGTIP